MLAGVYVWPPPLSSTSTHWCRRRVGAALGQPGSPGIAMPSGAWLAGTPFLPTSSHFSLTEGVHGKVMALFAATDAVAPMAMMPALVTRPGLIFFQSTS